MATQDGIVVGAGEGKVLLKDRWWLAVQASDTPGGTAIMENLRPAGAAANRPHRHNHHDEIWYVLDGHVTFRLGAREVVAGPGSCVIAPRGVIHQVHNATDAAARFLTINTPGTYMGYFEELGAAIATAPSGRADREGWDAIAAKYDVEFCDLPPLTTEQDA
jgi:mannose-6-phosphate isomerase-like protein (cupin superfamily)